MISRRLLFLGALIVIAVCFFTLGVVHARRAEAAVNAGYDARIEALRDEVRRELGREPVPAGTTGQTATRPRGSAVEPLLASRAQMIAQIKQELQSEMGLLPVQLLRERRSSFVELYADDNLGKTSYGTAGYLGHGYFVTVKHAIVALRDEDDRQSARRIVAIKVVYDGKEVPAKMVDAGKAVVEVDSGDWAIIKTRDLDLPPLKVDTAFAYDFADPIFRLGNDYSKGIVVSTGYVGQRTSGGLITCLTDGHPGVSGGGVLDQRGDLVGIPIGRMQGDYRFSFILPMRAEMLRKVPLFEASEP
jgi:S1-C subfamily serine protease